MHITFRLITRRDLPAVLEIEEESHEAPWNEADFRNALRQTACLGVLAESGGTVVGFAIYLTRRNEIELVNLAVAPASRRAGIGGRMIGFLKQKLSGNPRGELVVVVDDDSLLPQLFLKSQGFRATAVHKDFYQTGDTSYEMRFALRRSVTPATKNRIAKYFQCRL